jgi:putative transposase
VTDTNVSQLSQPGTFADPLTDVLHSGARALLTQAVEAEVAALLSCYADKLTDDGRQRLVRHGHLPEREVMTGIGPVAVRCPRVRDRIGKDAGGLSASTIGRLKDAWSDEHARWSKRDLSAKRCVYFLVDGIHVQARLKDHAQCLLVIIGATPEGKKELVGLIDGVRESAQSWKELLLDLKRRGLANLGDGRGQAAAN